jgi:hypothetical protein
MQAIILVRPADSRYEVGIQARQSNHTPATTIRKGTVLWTPYWGPAHRDRNGRATKASSTAAGVTRRNSPERPFRYRARSSSSRPAASSLASPGKSGAVSCSGRTCKVVARVTATAK